MNAEPTIEIARWGRDVDEALRARRRAQAEIRLSTSHPMLPAIGVIGWWTTRFSAATGGWTQAWVATVDRVVHEAFRCYVPWVTYAGTAASIRLRCTGSGIDVSTSSVALPENTASATSFEWLHGLEPWETVDLTVAVECNVTVAGVPNPLDLYTPYGGCVHQRYPIAATTTGL